MDRRGFLVRSGLAIGAAALATARRAHAQRASSQASDLADWESVRAEFSLDPAYLHFAGFFLASHPTPVRQAIERHRAALDANPVLSFFNRKEKGEAAAAAAAGSYLGVEPEHIALTDSTTMGLGLVYRGLAIRAGQEILTSDHDHYSTRTSLEWSARQSGAKIVRAPLYARSADATTREIVSSIIDRVTPRTRIVALTWVHSKSGLRLPVRALADALAPFNKGRSEEDRILLCIDGVHGLGAAPGDPAEMGCDVFIAGTHKWMFGPRGTGIVWARPEAWAHMAPIIPPFGSHDEPGSLNSPGGFHSFEHRWALDEAFLFHERIGKQRIYDRIRALNTRFKQAFAEMSHVTLHTPLSADLSAGIICFEVAGMTPEEVVDRLLAQRIIASVTPYEPSYARLAPGLLNNEEQVDLAAAAVRRLA